MWPQTPLPYRRADAAYVIPTTREIKSSKEILSERSGQLVVGVSEKWIVKYGHDAYRSEGETLLFLERCIPKVRSPRLFAMYQEEDELFLVMERCPGTPLQHLWPSLDEKKKQIVVELIGSSIREMRNFPCEQKFGSVLGGPLPHHMFYSPSRDPEVTGPFVDEVELNMSFIRTYREILRMNEQHLVKANFYERHISAVLCGHKAVFTHSDIQCKNIIVDIHDEKHETHETQGNHIEVFLVDWEDAGFYPSYWEYFNSYLSFTWENDWATWLEQALTPTFAETAVMSMIYKELYF